MQCGWWRAAAASDSRVRVRSLVVGFVIDGLEKAGRWVGVRGRLGHVRRAGTKGRSAAASHMVAS
jgi:hypothetical protein